MRRKKPVTKKIREWIQDNFFGLIIFLVIILIITLIISLFMPIQTDGFPDATSELNKYNAGVEQRTIIIRSISSIISGISVVIAFVSLLQSKNSELKRERMQVMPFPSYAVQLDDIQYASEASSTLLLNREGSTVDMRLKAEFDITIKNIGLGSFVDFEIKEAYYQVSNNELKELSVSFSSNFILGKQETIQMGIQLTSDFVANEVAEATDLEKLSILTTFNDLLGHNYAQEFTIYSTVRLIGKQKVTMPDGIQKTISNYTLKPEKIEHTHPFEQ